jgi:hypothetical protein
MRDRGRTESSGSRFRRQNSLRVRRLPLLPAVGVRRADWFPFQPTGRYPRVSPDIDPRGVPRLPVCNPSQAERPADIETADVVFLCAMIVQRRSFEQVVALCNSLRTPVVAGGPYVTPSYRTITGVDPYGWQCHNRQIPLDN